MACQLGELLDHQVLLAHEFFKLRVVDRRQVEVRWIGLVIKGKIDAFGLLLFEVVVFISALVRVRFDFLLGNITEFYFKAQPLLSFCVKFAPKMKKYKTGLKLTMLNCCALGRSGHLWRRAVACRKAGRCGPLLSGLESAASRDSSAGRHSHRLGRAESSRAVR